MRMLNTTPTILALTLGLPALVLGSQGEGGLRGEAVRLMAALESLQRLESDLLGGDASAVDAALAWSEAPRAEPELQDRRLDLLRGEVHVLQTQMDSLDPRFDATGAGAPVPDMTRAGVPYVGLDLAMRQRLAAPIGLGAAAPRSASVGSQDQPIALESEGYVADPLRLARLRYRQARFEEALTTLERLGDTPEGAYWRARCLRSLGRDGEALAVYRALAARADAGLRAADAADEARFLEWKLSFERRAKGGGDGS